MRSVPQSSSPPCIEVGGDFVGTPLPLAQFLFCRSCLHLWTFGRLCRPCQDHVGKGLDSPMPLGKEMLSQ